MKTLVLIVAGLVMMAAPAFAQSHACCVAPKSFASFTADAAFVAAHAEPVRMQYPTDGDMLSIDIPGGKPSVYYSVAPKNPTMVTNVLLVFHEWWGMNEHIKREADELFKALDGRVHVIAVDLYDGVLAYTRDEAASAMKDLRPERAEAIVNAIIAKQPASARIATIGWCMGGAWALQAGIIAGPKAAGVVMYYGMPEKNVSRLTSLQAPVLAIFAAKDEWITPAVAQQFEKDMKAAGKTLTLRSYDAHHAFANPSNPDHDRKATEQAKGEAVSFLRTQLLP